MRVTLIDKPGLAPKGFDTLIFNEGEDDAIEINLPSELARIVKTRIETMETFKHGLRADGKLMAMFRQESDMNYCHDLLEDIFDDSEWSTQSCSA